MVTASRAHPTFEQSLVRIGSTLVARGCRDEEAAPSRVPKAGSTGLGWPVHTDHQLLVLCRLPIERLSNLHREDDLHRRMMIEGAVFRAAAEYLDRDPWDLGPERFRYF